LHLRSIHRTLTRMVPIKARSTSTYSSRFCAPFVRKYTQVPYQLREPEWRDSKEAHCDAGVNSCVNESVYGIPCSECLSSASNLPTGPCILEEKASAVYAFRLDRVRIVLLVCAWVNWRCSGRTVCSSAGETRESTDVCTRRESVSEMPSSKLVA
jgi:hypothetical protein